MENPSVHPAVGASVTSLDASRRERESFHALFNPKKVAVIGATDKEGSVGLAIMRNLIAAFKGELYPVNPKRTTDAIIL